MLRFLKMDLKTHGSTPKNVKKRQKTAFLGVWNPSADPKNAVFWGRGGVPAPFLGCFWVKNRAGTPPKTCFFDFFAFFEGFWVVFDPFFHVF